MCVCDTWVIGCLWVGWGFFMMLNWFFDEDNHAYDYDDADIRKCERKSARHDEENRDKA